MSTTTNEAVQQTLWHLPDSRRAVYQELKHAGESTAPELAAGCAHTEATVYRSLRDLDDAGLVESRPNLRNPAGGDLWTVTDGESK